MRRNSIVVVVCLIVLISGATLKSERDSIYKKGGIDFNKNGEKDILEDSSKTVDDRVANLISLMNVEEKTCQLATIYDFFRVLEDELPTKEWKVKVWKNGIGNIVEHLNTIYGHDIKSKNKKIDLNQSNS